MRDRAVFSTSPLLYPLDFQAAAKRAMDLIGSAILLLLLAPLLAGIALLVKATSPGEILYRQARVGRGGQEFMLVKFRTMLVGADEAFWDALHQNPARRLEYATFQKLQHDPRLTRLGRILRRYSLDELPQLWNVLRGEMSLVGPRPFLPDQVSMYGPGLWLYVQTRPGMTGLWQISGRNQLSFQERTRCDLHYLLTWSIGSDLSILVQTPWTVIRGKGAF